MKFKIIYQINNKRKTKIVDARTKDEVYTQNDLPLNIIKVEPLKIEKQIAKFKFFTNKKKEVYELFKQLNIMLSSNLTINQSIELLLKTQVNRMHKDILLSIENAIKFSIPMDKALDSFKKYLGNTPILFLRLGVENGNIKESIASLVEILGEDLDSYDQVSDALRYPMILVFSLCISMGMIFIYVIPNFEFVFLALGDKMPLSTKVLLFMRDMVSDYSIIFIFSLSLIYYMVTILYKRNRFFYDKIMILNIPILSRLLQDYSFYRLFLLISIIVKSKYQFQIAILNSKNMVENEYIQFSMKNILINIKNGYSVANSFEQTGVFDDLTIKLLYTAEQTNQYEDILHDISLYYKKRFQGSLKNFSSFIEPVIILLISLIVLWLVLAIMVPVWDLGSVL